MKLLNINKLAIPVSVLALSVLISGSITTESDLSGPRLRSDLEVFDFGYAPQHAEVAHAFWLKNIGSERAIIEKVKTNCGCTQAPLADSLVSPGDSTWVEVILGTRSMIGSVEKYARVTANAVGRVPAFTVKVNILADSSTGAPVMVTPSAAYADSGVTLETVGGQWEFPVSFMNSTDRRMTLSAIDVPNDYIRLPESKFSIPAKGSHSLVLGINPAIMEEEYCKSITFEADDDYRTRITVPFGPRPAY